MDRTTRRSFIQNTAALAAGLAIGGIASKGIKEHGPIVIRAYFLTKDPIEIQGALFADEKSGIFGIRVFGDKREDPLLVELGLGAVSEALAAPGRRIRTMAAFKHPMDKNGEVLLDIVAKDGNLNFTEAEKRYSVPAWIALSDVRKVL